MADVVMSAPKERVITVRIFFIAFIQYLSCFDDSKLANNSRESVRAIQVNCEMYEETEEIVISLKYCPLQGFRHKKT